MSAVQVAELYGVTKNTVITWIAEGRFDPPPVRLEVGKGDRNPYVFHRPSIIAQRERSRGRPERPE